jgi:hypothetical protein
MEAIVFKELPEFVDAVMERLKIDIPLREQVKEEVAKSEIVRGKVSRITTYPEKKRKFVKDENGNETDFFFPPNTQTFEVEFERAQNHNKKVTVTYHKNDKLQNVIDSMSVED